MRNAIGPDTINKAAPRWPGIVLLGMMGVGLAACSTPRKPELASGGSTGGGFAPAQVNQNPDGSYKYRGAAQFFTMPDGTKKADFPPFETPSLQACLDTVPNKLRNEPFGPVGFIVVCQNEGTFVTSVQKIIPAYLDSQNPGPYGQYHISTVLNAGAKPDIFSKLAPGG